MLFNHIFLPSNPEFDKDINLKLNKLQNRQSVKILKIDFAFLSAIIHRKNV